MFGNDLASQESDCLKMSNLENEDEKLARDWLTFHSSDSLSVCRPACDPPDYVLNGETGVEVVRISEGDETSLHSLERIAESVLRELGPPGNGLSLSVMWVYEPARSLPEPKQMKEQIRAALTPYTKPYSMPGGIQDCRLPCGLSLRLVHLRHTKDEPCFKLHGFSGMTGEHVREQLLESFKGAAVRKTKAIGCQRNKFDTWWLVLVDRVFSAESFTFDGTYEGNCLLLDMKCIAGRLAVTERPWPWTRIVLLAPQTPCRGYDLFNSEV